MIGRNQRGYSFALSAALAASLTTALPAAAAQDSRVTVYADTQMNVERVPYHDLNLAAATDRKVLYGRVGRAVRNVCNFDSDGISSSYRLCAGASWADARPQIDKALDQQSLARTGATSISAAAIVVRVK